MSTPLGIITCSKQKLGAPAPAADLYAPSRLFSMALEQARAEDLEVLILSSKYGLVRPETVLAPYDVDIKTMSQMQNLAWQGLLETQVTALLSIARPACVWLFAGSEYRAPVLRIFRSYGLVARVHPSWHAIRKQAFS
jgi:hypothetical protein